VNDHDGVRALTKGAGNVAPAAISTDFPARLVNCRLVRPLDFVIFVSSDIPGPGLSRSGFVDDAFPSARLVSNCRRGSNSSIDDGGRNLTAAAPAQPRNGASCAGESHERVGRLWRDLVRTIALVTGGGRGIGRAIALALAREGAAVAISARSAGELDRTLGELRAIHDRVIAIRADVTTVRRSMTWSPRQRRGWGRSISW